VGTSNRFVFRRDTGEYLSDFADLKNVSNFALEHCGPPPGSRTYGTFVPLLMRGRETQEHNMASEGCNQRISSSKYLKIVCGRGRVSGMTLRGRFAGWNRRSVLMFVV
jgi:hypothetical protein